MWKDLTMQQRAELMDIYLQHGITSLDDIRRDYDLQSSDPVTAYPEDTNDYAHGGSIYIKPSHRGRFTRLKERTGHSASWFKEHGTPAQKKMATFALNAAKWKHGYGGNLYDGTSQLTQQMDNSYTYYKPLENIFVDSEGNLRDPEVPRARGSILLPEVTSAHPDLKDMAGRYNIASNDAITVANRRPVNMHLRKSVEEGAAKQAAWAQEHPYLNMAGIAAGAAPLAVASAPAVVGGGELTATALANPYVDAAITSAFAGHGLNHAINEGIDGWGDAAMTALELAPLGRLAKPVWNASKEGLQYAAKAADNTARYVSPSYDLYRTIGETTPQVSLGYDTLLRNYSKIRQVVPTNETPVLGWREATKPSVNWNADTWFKTISGRSSYSSEEAAELASHVPEYRAIEQRLFDEGKLTLDSNGNIVVVGSEMSPQEYIMRQSTAFQKMNPEHHYVGVSKRLRDNFENEARDPNTENRYEVWTDRKSPKNVEEYAYSQQGGYTNDSVIEKLQHEMTRIEKDYEQLQEQLKWRYEHGISQETYDRDLAALRKNYIEKQKDAQQELDVLMAKKQTDPLNGGKVFDVTYPKEAVETPIINAENNHWARIPFDNVVRDAPNVLSHYPSDYVGGVSTNNIVNAARRNGYDVTHIDNVMDTYDGTMLNETIIGEGTPVKSVLGNTGSFDIEGINKWKLYRSLISPFLGLGAAGALYGKQE